MSAFSVKVTAPIKQFFNVGSLSYELDAANSNNVNIDYFFMSINMV